MLLCIQVISGRREAELQRVAASLGDAAMVLPFDMLDTDFHHQAVDAVLQRFGRIDALVSSLHTSQRGPITCCLQHARHGLPS